MGSDRFSKHSECACFDGTWAIVHDEEGSPALFKIASIPVPLKGKFEKALSLQPPYNEQVALQSAPLWPRTQYAPLKG